MATYVISHIHGDAKRHLLRHEYWHKNSGRAFFNPAA